MKQHHNRLNQIIFAERNFNYEQLLLIILLIISMIITIFKPGSPAFAFLAVAMLLPIFFRHPKMFFIVLIVLKTLINGLYEIRIIGEINVLHIIGAFVPLSLIMYMLIRKIDYDSYIYHKLILIFLIEVIFGSIYTIYFSRDFIQFAKIIRLLNGITCYFAIPLIFKSDRDQKLLLKVWFIYSIFPLLLGLYQIPTSQFDIQFISGAGGLYRITGIYDDPASIASAGIIFVLILLFYFSKIRRNQNFFFLYLLLGLSILVVYRTYSRWGMISLAVFLILYSIYYKRKIVMIISFLLIFFVFFQTKSGIYARFETEMSTREKFGDRLMFTGRVGLWEKNWDEYINDYVPFQKLIGYRSLGNPHNDFIRILMDYGLIGLMLYVSLLTAIFLKLLKNILPGSDKSFLTKRLIFITFLSHIAFIIISFALTPSLWTDYQWFHWGLVGITLKRIHDSEIKQTKV